MTDISNKFNSFASWLFTQRSETPYFNTLAPNVNYDQLTDITQSMTNSINRSYQDSFEAFKAMPGPDNGFIDIRRDLAQRRIAKNTKEQILAMEFKSFKNFWDKYHNQGGDASLRLCDLSA